MDPAAQIVLQATEADVVPGQTARYPFTVRTGRHLPAVTEFEVRSENPSFDPRWARVVRTTDLHQVTSYLLEITPGHVHYGQYGRYLVQLSWAMAYTGAWCVLVIKPGVRLTADPDLTIKPGGSLKLTIENFGRADVDVSISLGHHGSSWSQGWDVELEAESGPVTFTEEFDPPHGGEGGTFTLTVSAAGIPLARVELTGRSAGGSRRAVRTAAITVAVLAAGAAIGVGLVLAGTQGPARGPAIAPTPVVRTQTSAPATTTPPPPPPSTTPTTPPTTPTTPPTTSSVFPVQ